MKMHISRDLLRQKIMADADNEADAGFPTHALEGIGMFLPPELNAANDDDTVRLKEAFGTLVRQLRRREKLTVEGLSIKARVEENELRLIEHDPHHRPRPRTVHQLANVFKLPERAFMKLSGATVTNDTSFYEEAYRFAAKSDDMAKLSLAERKALNDYISFLAKHNGD
ncbi:MAG: XRE family transcriptional regulator [Alphaproteobacteria bacterium]|nr:MAG: XRE family transcriptional regulator [Alphaproteobacteria bacterium]